MAAAAWAGAIWGAFNAHIQNRTQWEYLRTQAREMRVQANIIRDMGASEIRMFQRAAHYRRGAIVANWGHSGIAADSGSALETLLTQAATDGLTKLQMQRNTDQEYRNMIVSAQFADYSRKILDRQIYLQMTNAAIQGASAGSSAGNSFGSSFQQVQSPKGATYQS